MLCCVCKHACIVNVGGVCMYKGIELIDEVEDCDEFEPEEGV